MQQSAAALQPWPVRTQQRAVKGLHPSPPQQSESPRQLWVLADITSLVHVHTPPSQRRPQHSSSVLHAHATGLQQSCRFTPRVHGTPGQH